MLPAAVEAMVEVMGQVGNASSLHTSGRAARRLVEESRELVAEALGARPSEIIFTSGGTEADNLALAGVLDARRCADPRRARLVVSEVEHHAVIDTVEHLTRHDKAQVTWVGCDATGLVDAAALAEAIGGPASAADVAVVSVMWANNEVGTVMPVAQLAQVAKAAGIPFHTDAVQAVGQVEVDFAASGVDLLSVSGHKVGGPTGIGALVVGRDVAVTPRSFGGGQERQIRSGTLAVASIVGFATAIRHTVAEQATAARRLTALRDRLIHGATQVPGVAVSGPWTPGDWTTRLAGCAHLTVEHCAGDSLLYLLDAAGIECSTGSACQAGVPRPSHVLLAMGMPAERARGALRVTLGHTSTDAEVDAFLAALPGAVERAQRAEAATWRTAGA